MNTLSAAAFQAVEQEWQSLAYEIGFSPTRADMVWQDIVMRYGENGRYYHTLTHIFHVLETAKTVKSLALDWTAVQLAIWFHDIIYNPQLSDNEEKSAVFAVQILQDCAAIDIEKVQQLILATKTHQAPQDNDFYILLDADLAIFGTAPHKYAEYAGAIRQEYVFVADRDYRNGRVWVLNQFLKRPQIYHLSQLYKSFESIARKNIQNEITHL